MSYRKPKIWDDLPEEVVRIVEQLIEDKTPFCYEVADIHCQIFENVSHMKWFKEELLKALEEEHDEWFREELLKQQKKGKFNVFFLTH